MDPQVVRYLILYLPPGRCFQRRLAGFFCVCLLLLTGSLPGFAAPKGPPDSGRGQREDRILVRPRLGTKLDTLSTFHTSRGNRLGRAFKELHGLQVVHLPPGRRVADAIRDYENSGLVEYAEPDYQVQAALVPNDPQFVNGTLWGLDNIRATTAWDTQNSAANVIVAVIDSGIRYTHEDLAANLWVNPRDGSHGYNALNNSNNPWDDLGHGTQVAGVIGAAGNNGKGVSGVAWRVQIMACKFLDAAGNGFTSDAIECIEFARTNGAKVINASWGGASFSAALSDAIAAAGRDGIIFVAAAGNNGSNNDVAPFYPASYRLDNLVAVAGLTSANALAGFSNYGSNSVHLAAPGSAIYTTSSSSDTGYASASGTSMAAPFVSGAFALMRDRYPVEPPQALIARMLGAASPTPGLMGQCATGARLDLANVLNPVVFADFAASAGTGTIPLNVTFTNLSQGNVASLAWNFGDGFNAINTANPTHIFTNDGTFTVTLTVTATNGAQSRASRVIRVGANYDIQPAGFQWVDTDLMYPLTLNASGVSQPVSLPFPFVFYGKTYQQISVAANGVVGFGAQALTNTSPANLTNSPTAVLCPFWTELGSASSTSVSLSVRGKAPLRRVVLAWSPVTLAAAAGGGTGSVSFQAVLFESSQRILFQYQLTQDNSTAATSLQGATIGVSSENRLATTEYSNNQGCVLTNQQALLFVPTSKLGVTNHPACTLNALPSPSGQFALRLAGQPAGTYVIEASANLQLWSPISTVAANLDGFANLTDSTVGQAGQRFYRSRFVP